MKHTPGPWKASDGQNTAVIWGPGKYPLDYRVAECPRQGNYEDDTHNQNAMLIAAAPLMLSELESTSRDLRAVIDGMHKDMQAVVWGRIFQIEQAIATATVA